MLLTQRCSEEGPHIPLQNEKRDGSFKEPRTSKWRRSLLPAFCGNPAHWHRRAPTDSSTDTTQHPENAPKTRQEWEEARHQRDPKTTRQDSKSSQYEQHSQRGSVMGNHYDLKQQQHSEAKRCAGTHERADIRTRQRAPRFPTNKYVQQLKNSSSACERQFLRKANVWIKPTGTKTLDRNTGTFNFMHASNSQHTAKNKTLISKLKMQQSSDRTHQLKDKRSPGSRYNTCE